MAILYRVIYVDRKTGERSHGKNLWPDEEWAKRIARALTDGRQTCEVEPVETDQPPTDISNLWGQNG